MNHTQVLQRMFHNTHIQFLSFYKTILHVQLYKLHITIIKYITHIQVKKKNTFIGVSLDFFKQNINCSQEGF